MLTDMRDYLANKTDHWYLAHFNNAAETLVGVKDLANVGQMCEVSAIAVIE